VIAICKKKNKKNTVPEVRDAILLGDNEDSAACPIPAPMSIDPEGETRNAYWRRRRRDGVRVGVTGCVLMPLVLAAGPLLTMRGMSIVERLRVCR
jgi:predicted nuclease with RNAse H fold